MFEFFANAWNASIGNKAMLIGGGAVLLGAIGGLIFVLIGRLKGSEATGDEAFMTTPNGEKIHWDHTLFPIMIFFDPGFPEDYQKEYRALAPYMNRIVGKAVLDLFGATWQHSKPISSAIDVPIGHMYLTLADPDIDHKGGSNQFNYNPVSGVMGACYIKISPGLEGEQLATTIRHEVGGHGFGLQHDRLPDSIMYASADKRPKDFTDKDKERLKEMYG